MHISAKIIADSLYKGKRVTTFLLSYPRFIHSELMTHRVFSRNASSSRAVPVKKVLAKIWNDPAGFIHWGRNESGMVANEALTGIRLKAVQALWFGTGKLVCGMAYLASTLGAHKQIVNRMTEPWSHISVLVTATDFENFFHLRIAPDAQPEICKLATQMKTLYDSHLPFTREQGDWHLPFILEEERGYFPLTELKRMSAARCARLTYLTFDGKKDPNKDLELFGKLVGGGRIHASPLEHQCRPMEKGDSGKLFGNLQGWIQFRKEYELEHGYQSRK